MLEMDAWIFCILGFACLVFLNHLVFSVWVGWFGFVRVGWVWFGLGWVGGGLVEGRMFAGVVPTDVTSFGFCFLQWIQQCEIQ